jgi:IS4 transposase
MKEGSLYKVIERHDVIKGSAIGKDQTIRLTSATAFKHCPQALRRIEVWDEVHQRTLVFLTNHFGLAASTISAIYKDRWQIELFFKALKQNLKIKTFVGTSANAVRIQIWTALITMLLLRFLQLKSKWGWSLSNLVALLRMNLFTHRNLWAWLDDPFSFATRAGPYPQQAEMKF